MIYSSESESDKQFIYQENQQLQQLEEARRVEMMKRIGVFQSDDLNQQSKQDQGSRNPFAQNQMGQLKKRFDKNSISENKEKQYEHALVEQSAKKLRAKNTQLFLQTMKAELHFCFTRSIAFVANIQKQYQKQFPFVFQYINQDHFRIYSQLKAKKPILIQPQQLISFLKKIYHQVIAQQNQGQIFTRLFNPITLLWFFCLDLKIGLRKINLFDISKLNLQLIYDLNYNSKVKKAKKNVQAQLIERSVQQRIEKISMSMDSSQFQDIDSYAYNPNSKVEKGLNDQARKKQMTVQHTRVKDMVNNYPDNFYQLFCPISKQWKLISAKNYCFVQIQQVKQKVFDRKAIIGFFSTRIINVQKESKPIISFRQLKNIQIKDLTSLFADSMKEILKRRNRLGCKFTFKQYINLGKFQHPQEILTDIDSLIISVDKKLQKQMMMQAFPQTRRQMRLSQYFTIPSMFDKYKILRPGATDIGKKFEQEQVYLKKDLLRATSRLMWVDCSRMVKQGQQPVKTTENRQGNKTQLFCYSQTQPFQLKIDQATGKFLQDEQYKSIYVPPNFEPPQDCLIIKQKIGYVCKKNKFIHSKIVQGFNRANMKLVPNQLGFIIYKKDHEEIMKLHAERVQKLVETKQSREYEKTVTAWKKLFKQILIKQKIKREIA